MGEVTEVDLVGEPGGAWKKFLRIRVDIAIEKPLFPSFFLPHPNNSDSWIKLKYEKLTNICYKCGVIGHEERSCTSTLFQLYNPNGARFKAAGPWLQPGHDNLPPGVFEHPTSASNVVIASPENPPKNSRSSVHDTVHYQQRTTHIQSIVLGHHLHIIRGTPTTFPPPLH